MVLMDQAGSSTPFSFNKGKWLSVKFSREVDKT